MFCGNCGRPIDDDAKICPHCGAPVMDPAAGRGAEPGRYDGPGRYGSGYGGGYPRRRPIGSITAAGISAGLTAALIFWAGLLGNVGAVVAVLIAGYVLLKEKDEWLRESAVTGVAVIVCFGLLLGMVGLLGYVKDFICDIVNPIRMSSVYGYGITNGGAFYYILDLIETVIVFIRDLFLIIAGFAALRNRTFHVPVVDGLVKRHMGRM